MKYDNGNRNLILKFMRSRLIGGFFYYAKIKWRCYSGS
nr:MAG TPA: hypothetical protein [Caudoviricetes sp.]